GGLAQYHRRRDLCERRQNPGPRDHGKSVAGPAAYGKPAGNGMSKRGCLWLVSIVLAFVFLRELQGCFFAVHQTAQVIITQLGKPVGEPITDPGLHFKLPIIQEVNRIDKRFLEWDGAPVAIPTRAKTY